MSMINKLQKQKLKRKNVQTYHCARGAIGARHGQLEVVRRQQPRTHVLQLELGQLRQLRWWTVTRTEHQIIVRLSVRIALGNKRRNNFA